MFNQFFGKVVFITTFDKWPLGVNADFIYAYYFYLVLTLVYLEKMRHFRRQKGLYQYSAVHKNEKYTKIMTFRVLSTGIPKNGLAGLDTFFHLPGQTILRSSNVGNGGFR